jgi:lysophospholipase L1-like esterase
MEQTHLDGGDHGMASLKRRLKWLSVIPSLPIVALQAKRARKRIPRLPDASGPTSGTVHCSSSAGPELRLLVLGESTVSGVGAPTHELGLTGHIATALAESAQRTVSWRALGKNGATVTKVRQLLLPQIGSEPIDIVVIAVGANDAFRLTRVARWREDLEKIVTTLLGSGCKSVFIATDGIHPSEHGYAAWGAQLAAQIAAHGTS